MQSDRLRQALLFYVEQAIWTSSVSESDFNRKDTSRSTNIYPAFTTSHRKPAKFRRGMQSVREEIVSRRCLRLSLDRAIRDIDHLTGTASHMDIPGESVDYVFTDPPFGENIYYADLNFLVESWHKVTTDAKPEAIVDKYKKKALPEYQHLMQRCFAEYYRVLKPGRWMTVVFSNSQASVWNAIQVALQQAGFVVAEVTALDKVQGSYRQVTSTTAVKQDLVISAYKPNGGLEDRFNRSGATVESVWDFVQTHLKQLPVVKVTNGYPQELLNIVERDPRRIYDRMASWFIRHGTMVPISTPGVSGRDSGSLPRDGRHGVPA